MCPLFSVGTLVVDHAGTYSTSNSISSGHTQIIKKLKRTGKSSKEEKRGNEECVKKNGKYKQRAKEKKNRKKSIYTNEKHIYLGSDTAADIFIESQEF